VKRLGRLRLFGGGADEWNETAPGVRSDFISRRPFCPLAMRMHVMLRVADLDASIAFYTALFGTPPGKRKSDYARWLLDAPHVNFSIAQTDDTHGIEHVGIEAQTPGELDTLRQRIAQAEGTVVHEGQTTCCYANSDKTWITDANGVAWEAFFTSGDADTYRGESEPSARCCPPDCC
jgi:catechol 2,3-dioxygenase-like lactoylglutathione lyase family enzyme